MGFGVASIDRIARQSNVTYCELYLMIARNMMQEEGEGYAVVVFSVCCGCMRLVLVEYCRYTTRKCTALN